MHTVVQKYKRSSHDAPCWYTSCQIKRNCQKIRVAYQDRRTCISGKSNGLECSEQTLPLKL